MSQRLMRSGAAPMTGTLKLVDGSAGAPAVQFNSDGTTGFYKTADGIGVAVDGVKVTEFTANGIPRMIGEIVVWARISAPTGFVFPYGQTLSRSTYAALWAIAQTEISGGNTFFNNGNGSTTFGIGDLRGRVIAGRDNMGGSAAGRLTSAGGVSGTTLGASGGVQTVSLTYGQLPSATLSVNIPAGQGGHNHPSVITGGSYSAFNGGENFTVVSGLTVGNTGGAALPAMSGTASLAGSGQAHSNVQPTFVCNFLLCVGI